MSEEKKEMQGAVKWYNGKKGYGFVAPDDGSKDIFIHASALRDANIRFLNEGDKIKFTVEQSPKGPSCVAISKVE
jgi:CspA family cold shock protein